MRPALTPHTTLQDVREEAGSCSGQSTIEWDALKRIVAAVKERRGGDGPLLHEVRPRDPSRVLECTSQSLIFIKPLIHVRSCAVAGAWPSTRPRPTPLANPLSSRPI